MLMLILYVLGFPFMYGFLLIEMFKSADEVSLLTLIATLFVGFVGALLWPIVLIRLLIENADNIIIWRRKK